jgi:hypothetical protein
MLSRTLSRISSTLKRKKIDKYDYWFDIITKNKKIKKDILFIIDKNEKILKKYEKIPTNIIVEYCNYVKKDIHNNDNNVNECGKLKFHDTIIYFLQNLIEYLPNIKDYHNYKKLYLKKYKNSTLDITQSELKNVNFFIEIDNNEQHLQSIKEKIISENKIILNDKITDFFNTINEIDTKNNFDMSNESDDDLDDDSSDTSSNEYSSNSSQKLTSSDSSDPKGGKRIKTKKQCIKSKKTKSKQKANKKQTKNKKILQKKYTQKKYAQKIRSKK